MSTTPRNILDIIRTNVLMRETHQSSMGHHGTYQGMIRRQGDQLKVNQVAKQLSEAPDTMEYTLASTEMNTLTCTKMIECKIMSISYELHDI